MEDPLSRMFFSRRELLGYAAALSVPMVIPLNRDSEVAASAAQASSSLALASWDTMSDTWVGTDSLGRVLPTSAEVGGPKPDRCVGMFYFLWHGAHSNDGPFDITRILAQYPEALQDANHPAWGGLIHPHHWGESQFGYYLSNDRFVLRKHAQMLADAGIDVLIFDVSNGFTYREQAETLFEEFTDVRLDGNPSPAVAYLCPFWNPVNVACLLYLQLYSTGLYSDLWFNWKGKPLILAHQGLIDNAQDLVPFVGLPTGNPSELLPGHTQGQTFTAPAELTSVGASVPTWATTGAAVTLTLHRNGVGGQVVFSQRFTNIVDNQWLTLSLPGSEPAGAYYLEMSDPFGRVGWWTNPNWNYSGGDAYADGAQILGSDRSLRVNEYIRPQFMPIGGGDDLLRDMLVPVQVTQGTELGQTIAADDQITAISVRVPTWNTTTSGVTVTVRSGGSAGIVIAEATFSNVMDNGWLSVELSSPQPAGVYYVALSNPVGQIGWWTQPDDLYPYGTAYVDGSPITQDRAIRLTYRSVRRQDVLDFFTFRKPQPDYFTGDPVGETGWWGWLQDHPQQLFNGGEQMTTGASQNIINGRTGAFSDMGGQGRSWRNEGTPAPNIPADTPHGYNFAEQWEHILVQNPVPEFVFVTGWNEWYAFRLTPEQFPLANGPVVFVDTFTQEYSRDLEPMTGGHGDDYYYQLVSYVRKYKGVRSIPSVSARKSIVIDGSFDDWVDVAPEFRDHRGDVTHRNHSAYGSSGTQYVNASGRNDIVMSKVARDASYVYFYVQTSSPLTAFTDDQWMMLLLRVHGVGTTSWEGYNFIANRSPAFRTSTSTNLEAHTGGSGWNWGSPTTVQYRMSGSGLEVAIPRNALGLTSGAFTIDFKWVDNIQDIGNIRAFDINGDVAPSGRFAYRFQAPD